MLRKSAIAICMALSINGLVMASSMSDLSAKTVYYQHASNAVLINNTKGQYVLTMVGVANRTLLYEGSFKSADKMSTEKFFDNWVTYGFNKKSPIVAIVKTRKNKSLSFKLKDPEYNMVKKTVHYIAEPQEEIEVSEIGTNWNEIVILFERNFGDGIT
ncbi:MAG: hypothetical protein P0S95_07870 [Rhabdochlamydiaceae bacterium]|nr:hypothetical protein [Candidatus Amphrikana amoebophyrae]